MAVHLRVQLKKEQYEKGICVYRNIVAAAFNSLLPGKNKKDGIKATVCFNTKTNKPARTKHGSAIRSRHDELNCELFGKAKSDSVFGHDEIYHW